MPEPITETAASLRVAADLLAQHPALPAPYVTSHTMTGEVTLSWYLMLPRDTAPKDQGAIALTIFDAIGGAWTQSDTHTRDVDDRPIVHWEQQRGPLTLVVQVHPVVLEVCS